MKKFLLSLLAIIALSGYAKAQDIKDPVPVGLFGTTPGSCTAGQRPVVYNGGVYVCVAGTYTALGTGSGSGTIGGSIAANQVAYGSGVNAIAGDATFVWDNTNKQLGVLSAGSATTPSIAVNTTGTGFYFQNTSISVLAATVGGTTSGAGFFNSGIVLGNNKIIKWSTNANPSSGTYEVGIYDNGSGVLEINNGTAGTYADLRIRALAMGTVPSWTTGGTALRINPSLSDLEGAVLINIQGIFAATAGNLSAQTGQYQQTIFRSAAYKISTITNFGAIGFLRPEMTNATDIAGDAVQVGTFYPAIYGGGSTKGTYTNTYVIRASTLSNQIVGGDFRFTNIHGVYVDNQGTPTGNAGATVTSASGITIAAQSGATNNTALLIGTTSIPSGNYAVYSASTNKSYLTGTLQVVGDIVNTGMIGVGVGPQAGYMIYAQATPTVTSGNLEAHGVLVQNTPASASTATIVGGDFSASTTGTAASPSATNVGGKFQANVSINSPGSQGTNRGGYFSAYLFGSGTISSNQAVYLDHTNQGTGTISNNYGFYISSDVNSGGTTTNDIGGYIAAAGKTSGTLTSAASLVLAAQVNATNNSGLVIGQSTIPSGTYGAYIVSSAATAIPLTIKGAASQSGDLFQAQDSSAGIRAKINKDGDFVFQSSNTSGVSSITHNNDSINFGAIASAYGGIGFVGSSAPTTANYALAGDFSGTLTLLNVGTGGTISFRVNNSAAATLTSTAFTLGTSTNFFAGPSTIETFTTTGSAFGATLKYYTDSQTIYRNTGTAANDVTVNVDASASVDLNTRLATGQAITVVVTITNGGVTAYKVTALHIHGVGQTIKWPNGTAPTAGLSEEDWYTFTILKTGASTYYVTGVMTAFK